MPLLPPRARGLRCGDGGGRKGGGREGRSLGTPTESVIDARSFPRSASCCCCFGADRLKDQRTRVEFGVLLVPDDGRLGLGVVHHARQLHLLVLLHFKARPGQDPGQLNLCRRN